MTAFQIPSLAALAASMVIGTSIAHADHQVVYVQSNNIEDGMNSIVAYVLGAEGTLDPLPGSPFMTGGTGIDNNTNGKLGPNDNDTPIVVSDDGKRLFAVNGHSDTIAVMDIMPNGSLRAVPGSPFPSMGVGPVSLSIAKDILLVAQRNEDPARLGQLRGAAKASYTSFRIAQDGCLEFISEFALEGGEKPTQILAASKAPWIAFGNDFQVDADFDADGAVSKLFNKEPSVQGGIHSFRVDPKGKLEHIQFMTLPETASPAPDVPTIPLGIWDHPSKNILYAGFVTRNELGVFRYDSEGKMEFVTAVPNSGQDICWLKPNRDGTRLYAVNNLPREGNSERSSTVTVFDISGDRAEKPVEMQRIALPLPLGTFMNNRVAAQPNSTAFQPALDRSGRFLFVVNQRVNQTPENMSPLGNVLHVLKIEQNGTLKNVDSRDLTQDGVAFRARPQGIAVANIRS